MKKRINLIMIILWMILIFIMSSFDSVESSNQSSIIVNYISKLFNITNIDVLTIIVRKLAHFTEYFILGILLYNYFKEYKKGIVISLIYAITDEFHQIFISGRSAEIMDILIDVAGAIVGIVALNLVLTYLINRSRK